MKLLKLSKRYYTIGKPIKKARESPERYLIYKEFEEYQKNNYNTIPVECLCNNNTEYLISNVDREGFEYPLMICTSCGLIKAREYWDEKSTNHFYSNWYRKKYGDEENPDKYYKKQSFHSKLVWDYVNEYMSKLNTPYTVFDIGGGTGGILDLFKSENNCYLFDFNKPFLKKANEMGIKTIEGGIDKLNLIKEKPDLVILSHVLEHFTNVHQELETLKRHLKLGSLVYVELPGIDSLREGRRTYDFLGDIHKPHVFYFSCGVLNNLMERYGFKCLKSNTLISALYKYTGETGELVNYHDTVCSLINISERRRKLGVHHVNKAGRILPSSFKRWVKKRLPWFK